MPTSYPVPIQGNLHKRDHLLRPCTELSLGQCSKGTLGQDIGGLNCQATQLRDSAGIAAPVPRYTHRLNARSLYGGRVGRGRRHSLLIPERCHTCSSPRCRTGLGIQPCGFSSALKRGRFDIRIYSKKNPLRTSLRCCPVGVWKLTLTRRQKGLYGKPATGSTPTPSRMWSIRPQKSRRTDSQSRPSPNLRRD